MTRKDYELVAETLKEMNEGLTYNATTFNSSGADYSLSVMRELVNNLSDKLQGENSRFDRTKFWKACGL
jgi:hypothetical protein